jgi:tetratricopeptide (TPR) repeat protein
LAVFPDTFASYSAAAVWEVEVDQAQYMLGELMATSLVEWNETSGRYRLHDLARLFADSKLSAEERTVGQKRFAKHYRDVLAAANELYLKGGASLLNGLALFDLEWGNIQAGHTWVAAHASAADVAELGMTYPDVGVHVLDLRQHPHEQIRWLEIALTASQRLKDKVGECNALGNLGVAYDNLGETRRAIDFYGQTLVIARKIGDKRGVGASLGNLGIAYVKLGETQQAIELFEQHLSITREIGDRRGEGAELDNLGSAYVELGKPRLAIQFYEQRLTIAREIGDRRGESATLTNLGSAYFVLGEIQRAIQLYEEHLPIAREIGDRRHEGITLGNLGLIYANVGNPSRAMQFYEKALFIDREIGDRRNEGTDLWNMSLALDQLGKRAQAIHHAEQALTIFEQTEDPTAAQVREQLAAWR